jgi:AmmeMemoRadiSam system protein B
MQTITRHLRYAGSWYEADPVLLGRQMNSFFAGVKNGARETPDEVCALVVPHAGYAYSGAAAAAAYRTVIGKKVDRIFLLGPSHHVGFSGVGLTKVNFFETPFGELSIDQKVVMALLQEPHFLAQEEGHALEHSLEMQLPFIKKFFPEVSLVPLLVGTLQGEQEIREIAASIKSHLQENDLIIVSSDFTHYGPRFEFMPCPEQMQEKIQELDTCAYGYVQQFDVSGLLNFYQETGVTICGLYPIAILLALLPSHIQVSLLSYYTSQDIVKNDPEHSVSYMTIVFSKHGSRER